jgi:hypothetical protein
MITPNRVRKLRSYCARIESIASRNALRKLFQERMSPELLCGMSVLTFQDNVR